MHTVGRRTFLFLRLSDIFTHVNKGQSADEIGEVDPGASSRRLRHVCDSPLLQRCRFEATISIACDESQPACVLMRAQPGAAAVQLNFPQKPGDPVTVRTKEPRDWHRIGLNYVYLEPGDARVLGNIRFCEANAATQAILFMYPLHFGRFGGHWNTTAFYGVMALYVILGIAPFAPDGDWPGDVLESVAREEMEAEARQTARAGGARRRRRVRSSVVRSHCARRAPRSWVSLN
jgi:hypothetical protein